MFANVKYIGILLSILKIMKGIIKFTVSVGIEYQDKKHRKEAIKKAKECISHLSLFVKPIVI